MQNVLRRTRAAQQLRIDRFVWPVHFDAGGRRFTATSRAFGLMKGRTYEQRARKATHRVFGNGL